MAVNGNAEYQVLERFWDGFEADAKQQAKTYYNGPGKKSICGFRMDISKYSRSYSGFVRETGRRIMRLSQSQKKNILILLKRVLSDRKVGYCRDSDRSDQGHQGALGLWRDLCNQVSLEVEGKNC